MIRDAIVDAVVHAPDLIRQVAIQLVSLIKSTCWHIEIVISSALYV